MIELLNIDCMPFLMGCETNSFDLAIIDCQYGIGESGDKESRNRVASNNYKPKGWDNEPPSPVYFDQLRRVSKNQIIFGANHFIDNFPFMCNSPCWIVWDKDNGGCDFADAELAWTSFDTAVRIFKYRWAGMLQGDMKNKEYRIHPTQKPVKLYDWLLSNYAKEGDRILDTHGGSMSSAIAAHYGGFDMVICELDKDYFEAGKKRFDAETRQIDIFA